MLKLHLAIGGGMNGLIATLVAYLPPLQGNFMQRLVVIAFGIALAGCNSSKPVGEMNYSEINKLADQIRARCAAQGAGPGTPQWETCAKIEMNSEVVSRDNATAELKQMEEDRRRRGDIAAAAAASQPIIISPGASQGTYLNTSSGLIR